jgi:flagella basal body P-ring formation protein FlgA
MTTQMLCLKKTDTQRFKRCAGGLAAALLSHATLGFAANLTGDNSAMDQLQQQALQWAAVHPAFKGKTVHVAPVDPRITVQNCQQNLQFEQPFTNQPAVRVRCTQPQWQLFVTLNAGPIPAPVNSQTPATTTSLSRVLVSKELLKRGTVITPDMLTYAEMPASGMEAQIISDTNLLKNLELVRDLTPNTPLRSYDVKSPCSSNVVKRFKSPRVKVVAF